tara:strand:+ start:41 stop:952 length:912 start_codon:yes stop_codon:yes gene_type:complete
LIKFLQGNVFEKVKELDDNSIDCVVTSPPYWGLRDYGVHGQLGLESTYQEHIKNIVKLFRAIKPKLKDSATIWLNYGDSYSSGKRTSTTNQTLRGNKNYGVTRTPIQEGIKEKDLIMIPNRIAIALQDDGWWIRSEIIWHKPNPMPESVRDRPTSCHEKIWLITKSKKYYYDAETIKEQASGRIAGNKKPQKGTDQKFSETKQGLLKAQQKPYYFKNKRNVWTITTKPFKDAHFATFPKDLIEPCIKAGCPENGTVLDPFGGSGTTAIVAVENNRNAILIELNKKYIDIAKKRIVNELGLFNK